MLSFVYHSALVTAQAPPIPPAAACIPGSPGCQDPYPPGTESIGESWWAIGHQYSGLGSDIIIKSVSTFLDLPEPPRDSPGLIILNTALDNSVSRACIQRTHPTGYRIKRAHTEFRRTLN